MNSIVPTICPKCGNYISLMTKEEAERLGVPKDPKFECICEDE